MNNNLQIFTNPQFGEIRTIIQDMVMGLFEVKETVVTHSDGHITVEVVRQKSPAKVKCFGRLGKNDE